MNLTYGQIESLLKRLHGVVPKKTIALKGRLNHFQRAKFPPNVNVGRGPRAIYDVEATFALIFAFELLRLRIPPLTTVQMVTANWPLYRRMLVLGWRTWIASDPERQTRRSRSTPKRRYKRPFAVIFPAGLEDLSRPGRPTGEFERVQIVEGREITSWLTGSGSLTSPAVQILDFVSVIGRTLDTLVELGVSDLDEDGYYQVMDFLDVVEGPDAPPPPPG
ncbi:MAG TPA: hypothetical protein VF680_07515 [Allosphingosinicella sp.]|jgi:hypothetical protein